MRPIRRSRAATVVRSGPIDDIFATLARRPDVISFAAGAPDGALLPVELLTELVESVSAKYGPVTLQYGMTRGFAPMLEQAQRLLHTRQIDCSLAGLHITTGGSGALHNICMAVLDPGAVVLVETPTYAPAVKTFQAHGATAVGVECDEFGIRPEALDQALATHDAAFVYLLPTFQNPTGRTVPAQRRAQLAEVVRRREALVVEDDIYADLRYRGEPVPAFWSFAPENTIYVTSVSKTLAPAVRVGIAVTPPELSECILALKQTIDMQTSTLGQAIAAEFLGSGQASAHLERLRGAYSTKLNTLVGALERHFPGEFSWTEPDGGLFVWVDGPPDFDADALLDQALEHGVAFLPGSVFYADGGANHRNTMRLSIGTVVDDEIDAGIKRLATLCAR